MDIPLEQFAPEDPIERIANGAGAFPFSTGEVSNVYSCHYLQRMLGEK